MSGDDRNPHDDAPDDSTGSDEPDEPDRAGETTDESLGTPTDRYDLPADVEATLLQLLSEAAAAARRRDVDEALALVETVETVSKNKVPAESLRERLHHGCETVERLVADEPLVAAEYLEAMARLVDPSDN